MMPAAQRMAVMGVIIGIVCSASMFLFFLHTTHSLSSALKNMDSEASKAAAGRIAGDRKMMDQEFKKRYAAQLSSFSRLAQDLQNEKDKVRNLNNKATDLKKNLTMPRTLIK